MVVVTRISIGVLGALFVLLALGFWFGTDALASKMGLDLTTLAGRATVRADVAAFFLTGGVISVYAAIKRNAAYLWPVLLLLVAAISGRALTLILDGAEPASFPPMIVEALAIVLVVVCQRTWPKAA